MNLEYPENLHDAHNDYPLDPEALSIHMNWLSARAHERVGRQAHRVYEFSTKRAIQGSACCSLPKSETIPFVGYANRKDPSRHYIQTGRLDGSTSCWIRNWERRQHPTLKRISSNWPTERSCSLWESASWSTWHRPHTMTNFVNWLGTQPTYSTRSSATSLQQFIATRLINRCVY